MKTRPVILLYLGIFLWFFLPPVPVALAGERSPTSTAVPEGSNHLADKHEAKGLSCAACHGTDSPEKGVKKEECLSCHGSYGALSEKSQIHAYMTAPHFPGGDDCGHCHQAHAKSVLLCNKCHEEINLKVP